ncbi:MAG: transposase [Bacillota bacterium]
MQESKVKLHMGRPCVPVDQCLRLMYLKHAYQLSYESLVREVSDSIKWRTFYGFSMADKLPDPGTLVKLTRSSGPKW